MNRFVQYCNAVLTIAYKEFIHVWRDRRVLFSIIVIPPFFTLVFGHALADTAPKDVPAMYYDADQSRESRDFLEALKKNETFSWKPWRGADPSGRIDLLNARTSVAIVIPAGWGKGLTDGNPLPIRAVLDGADTTTAPTLEGVLQEALANFQMKQRDAMIDTLPDEVFEMGEKLPASVREEFNSAMTPWTFQTQILYNPNLRFIEFIMPGIIGLILQLLTVTLIASTITREREVGTLSQLLVTPLRHSEIVLGKVLPYLVISLFLIAGTIALGHYHFSVKFHQPVLVSLICLLFLLFSLGLGVFISSISRTQTQAIQFSIFFMLPMLLLSGAFIPVEGLPDVIQAFAQLFPLTHFCHAFRLVDLYGAHLSLIVVDLLCLAIGAAVTCGAAAYLLRAADE
ncbi:MAG: ABC transporter permease [Verrucomicrobia bacterium]|nr:ABC transporter permease [Verrucomicrobiota bacterium]